MSVVSNNILAGASGQGGAGYEIERSLRFNPGDTPRLSKTFATTNTTFTASFWLKRSGLANGYQHIFSSTGSSSCSFEIADNVAHLYNQAHQSSSVYLRDPSAWYHIVLSVTAGTCTLYINNSQVLTGITGFSYGGYSTIGSWIDNGYNLDGYLADVHFIDGQALAPTDFGETDDNGVWQPKKFAGTYGPLVDQSQTWSSGMKTTTTANTSYSTTGRTTTFPDSLLATAPFDADLTNFLYSQTGVGGTWLYVEFGTALANVTSIVFSTEYSCPGGVIKLNGTDVAVNQSNIGGGFVEVSVTGTIPSSLTEIAIQGYTGSARLKYLKINNKYLLDSGVTVTDNSFHLDFADNSSNAALGTDTSGNSNTWTVNNLSAAGTNWIQSKIWSNESITSTGSIWSSPPDSASLVAANMFDSSLSSYVGPYSGGTLTVPFGQTFSGTKTWRVYWEPWVSGETIEDQSGNTLYTASGAFKNWVSFSGTNVSGLKFTSLTSGNSSNVYAIEVDGNILVDSDVPDPLAAGIDSLVDTPTNGDTASDTGAGGEVVGNYCILNPLSNVSQSLKNGNLETSGVTGRCTGTIYVSSGKYYWEVKAGSDYTMTGIESSDNTYTAYPGGSAEQYALYGDGNLYHSGSVTTYTAFNAGDILGFLLDMDAGELRIRINNTAINSGNAVATGLTGKSWTANCRSGSGGYDGDSVFNFGQRAFTYAAPSGYKTLNTANLPEPTIADGSKYFDTKLYTSNSSSLSVTGYEFSPSFVWIKNRASAQMHGLFDIVRGANQFLSSNRTNAEHTTSGSGFGTGTFNSFDSNGFTLGDDIGQNSTNYPSGEAHVAWAWDAGSSNTTIAAGGTFNSQSQVWSTYGTFTGSFSTTYVWANVFNDSMAYDGSGSMYLTGAPAKWTLTAPIACYSGVKFYIYGNTSFTINDGLSDEVTSTSAGGNAFHYFTIPFSGNISSIQVNNTSQYLMRIYVDGAALVDTGITVTNGDPTTAPIPPSIASTVRANPSAGFSIVSYNSGSSTGNYTLGHGLNSAPQFIIHKSRSTSNWWAYHESVIDNTSKYLWFNNTSAVQTNSAPMWGAALPTSSVFGIRVGDLIGTSQDAIAYCFAPVEGYSAFGSYTGNGSADGPFVYTGFRPKWLLYKRTDAADTVGWILTDSERNAFNVVNVYLAPNTSSAEGSTPIVDFLSNGFKLKIAGADGNISTGTYIYAAFAEHPFKTARAR